jgi:hypothetical protein
VKVNLRTASCHATAIILHVVTNVNTHNTIWWCRAFRRAATARKPGARMRVLALDGGTTSTRAVQAKKLDGQDLRLSTMAAQSRATRSEGETRGSVSLMSRSRKRRRGAARRGSRQCSTHFTRSAGSARSIRVLRFTGARVCRAVAQHWPREAALSRPNSRKSSSRKVSEVDAQHSPPQPP